jgi:hypothetical protein
MRILRMLDIATWINEEGEIVLAQGSGDEINVVHLSPEQVPKLVEWLSILATQANIAGGADGQ